MFSFSVTLLSQIGPTACITWRHCKSPGPVTATWPVGIGPFSYTCFIDSSISSRPAALAIAPATPAPCAKRPLAALVIASVVSLLMSLWTTSTVSIPPIKPLYRSSFSKVIAFGSCWAGAAWAYSDPLVSSFDSSWSFSCKVEGASEVAAPPSCTPGLLGNSSSSYSGYAVASATSSVLLAVWLFSASTILKF